MSLFLHQQKYSIKITIVYIELDYANKSYLQTFHRRYLNISIKDHFQSTENQLGFLLQFESIVAVKTVCFNFKLEKK